MVEEEEKSENIKEEISDDPQMSEKTDETVLRESLRVQKAAYIKEQIQKQREAEDAVLAQLLQEQLAIDELNTDINSNLERTSQSRKYNEELKASINAQIYAMHGVSEDKLEGMGRAKSAYYRGCAFSLFLLSIILIILCGVLHGFGAKITLFMLAFTGIEGTLLVGEKQRVKLLEVLCKFLYLLIFPAMMFIFVCYELEYPEYNTLMPYMIIAGIAILIIGSATYFLYNPYREEKKKMRDARDHIRDIERLAQKEVRKNQKLREKEEKRTLKLLQQQEADQKLAQEKAEIKQQKQQERAEKRAARKQWFAEKKEYFF